MTGRRRPGPERPFAVLMAVVTVLVVIGEVRLIDNYRGWLDIVIMAALALYGLLCTLGAVELWRMGGER